MVQHFLVSLVEVKKKTVSMVPKVTRTLVKKTTKESNTKSVKCPSYLSPVYVCISSLDTKIKEYSLKKIKIKNRFSDVSPVRRTVKTTRTLRPKRLDTPVPRTSHSSTNRNTYPYQNRGPRLRPSPV